MSSAQAKQQAKPAAKADKPAAAKPAKGKGKPAAEAPVVQKRKRTPRPPMPKMQPGEPNPNAQPRIEKVTVNIGVGEGGERLDKAERLLQKLTGQKPMRTFGKVNNRELGVRPGMPIGCKVTLRGEGAEEFVQRALYTRNRRVHSWSFDNQGNLQFGVADHTNFEGERYDPEIGVFGMDVCLTLVRGGVRIKRRKALVRTIPNRQRVTRDEAVGFLSKKFNIEVI